MNTRDLAALTALADAGSLLGAARRLGVATSTVARRLATLEAALGLALIDRRQDGTRLTAAGTRMVALGRPLAEHAARIQREADTLRGRAGVERPVTLSATDFVASELLASATPALYARAPDVVLHLRSEGQVVSLAAREADVAVRMVRPDGASLVARRLATIALGLFAAPAYLAGRDPAAIDVGAERLLAYDDSYGRIPEAAWIADGGLTGAVVLRTGSTRALLNACAGGAGIALLPVAFAVPLGLVAVPSPLTPPPRQPWLVTHRDARALAAVRAVRAWVVDTFAAGLAEVRPCC